MKLNARFFSKEKKRKNLARNRKQFCALHSSLITHAGERKRQNRQNCPANKSKTQWLNCCIRSYERNIELLFVFCSSIVCCKSIFNAFSANPLVLHVERDYNNNNKIQTKTNQIYACVV